MIIIEIGKLLKSSFNFFVIYSPLEICNCKLLIYLSSVKSCKLLCPQLWFHSLPCRFEPEIHGIIGSLPHIVISSLLISIFSFITIKVYLFFLFFVVKLQMFHVNAVVDSEYLRERFFDRINKVFVQIIDIIYVIFKFITDIISIYACISRLVCCTFLVIEWFLHN